MVFGILLRLIASVVVGLLLIYIVYLIPIDPIEKHVANSAETFEKEGAYPSFSWIDCNSGRDNYTDAWMLLEASYKSDTNAITQSMLNYRKNIDWVDTLSNPVDTLVQHYKYGKVFTDDIMYGRYWNGYLVYLKPLLFLFDYSVIRYINIGLQLLIYIIIIVLLVRKKKSIYILPYVISILMIMPFALVLNIQQSTCYTIFNIGIIAVLMYEHKLSEKGVYIFLFLGIATSFFDLLSYPLVTFGVPAVFFFSFTKSESVKTSLIKMLKIGLAWIIGYGGMWFSKWIVGSIITGNNLISNGLSQVVFRSGANEGTIDAPKNVSIAETLLRNVNAFKYTPITKVLLILVIALVIIIIIQLIKFRPKLKELCQLAFPFLLLMLAPLVWYAIIRNHSAIHYYIFANKILIITVMSFICMCVKLLFYYKSNNKRMDNVDI